MSENALNVNPGYRSTEFWGIAIFNVVSFIVASGAIPDGGWVAQVAGLILGLLGSLGYGQLRTEVKNASALYFEGKPKWKSTEYIMLAVTMVFGLVVASGVIPTEGVWPKITGLATSALAALGYGQLRASIKVTEIKDE